MNALLVIVLHVLVTVQGQDDEEIEHVLETGKAQDILLALVKVHVQEIVREQDIFAAVQEMVYDLGIVQVQVELLPLLVLKQLLQQMTQHQQLMLLLFEELLMRLLMELKTALRTEQLTELDWTAGL